MNTSFTLMNSNPQFNPKALNWECNNIKPYAFHYTICSTCGITKGFGLFDGIEGLAKC